MPQDTALFLGEASPPAVSPQSTVGGTSPGSNLTVTRVPPGAERHLLFYLLRCHQVSRPLGPLTTGSGRWIQQPPCSLFMQNHRLGGWANPRRRPRRRGPTDLGGSWIRRVSVGLFPALPATGSIRKQHALTMVTLRPVCQPCFLLV